MRQQRMTAQRLSRGDRGQLIELILTKDKLRVRFSYVTVSPECFSVLVTARTWQLGQRTGAGSLSRDSRGVTQVFGVPSGRTGGILCFSVGSACEAGV